MACPSRRQVLQLCALGSASALFLPGCTGDRATACFDPDTLSRGEEQMRKTLKYVDATEVTGQQCSNCQFYHAATADSAKGCGSCELLDGPVGANAYCTSWAATT